MLSVTLSAGHCITSTLLYHLFLPTMKLSVYWLLPPFYRWKNWGKGKFGDQPKDTQLSSGGVCYPQPHALDELQGVLALATSALMAGNCLEKQRRPRCRQDHAVPPPSTNREKGAEGSWKARLLACSLMAPFRYNVVWQHDYKKHCSLKTGAAQALSPPKDFFCKVFCSLQETPGMLLCIKRKESHLLTKLIQKMLEELLRSRKYMGILCTLWGRAPRTPFPDKHVQLQKSEQWSLIHSTNIPGALLCVSSVLALRASISPRGAHSGSLIISH